MHLPNKLIELYSQSVETQATSTMTHISEEMPEGWSSRLEEKQALASRHWYTFPANMKPKCIHTILYLWIT